MTNAELAILSLIVEKTRHGYEIEHVIEERGMREWTEVGFSSIYYLLKKLEKKGLIKAQLEQSSGRGPARKVYQVTHAGEEEWRIAVLEALSKPVRSYPPFLMGLANLSMIAHERVMEALDQYGENLIKRSDYISSQAENQQPLPDHVELMFDYSLTLIEAEHRWIERIIKKLEEENVED